ncbi:hypothetical protein S245_055865, partial [Arachis hypogaea]
KRESVTIYTHTYFSEDYDIIMHSYEEGNKKEKATGVKPSLKEVYTKCHTKKDKSWIDERSEKVI